MPDTKKGSSISLPEYQVSRATFNHELRFLLDFLLELPWVSPPTPFHYVPGYLTSLAIIRLTTLLHCGHPLAAVAIAVAVRDRFELELGFQRGRISFHKVKTVNLYHVATTGLTDFAFCLRLWLCCPLSSCCCWSFEIEIWKWNQFGQEENLISS